MSDAKRVLIIDDDVIFAEFLRACVESVGHEAVICTDGTQAVAAFRADEPDLILLDILLPKKDGFQICREIRDERGGATVPVVMLTGVYKKPAYEREALETCKVAAYLHKPVHVPELWAVFERHLGLVKEASPLPPDDTRRSLSEVPLVTLVAEQVEKASSGVLFVRGASESHALYFRYGEPYFVRSNAEESRLQQVLQQTWQVDPAQVEQAQELVAKSRGRLRLGRALVQSGALSQEQFETALQLQLQVVLKHAFRLKEGSAFFAAGDPPDAEDMPLELSPKGLLMLGARHSGSRQALRSALPAVHERLHRVEGQEEGLGELHLSSVERALLETVNGEQSVEQFCSVAGCSGVDGEGLLLGLLLCGQLEHRATERRPSGLRRPYADREERRWARLAIGATVLDLHERQATGSLSVRAEGSPSAKTLLFREGELVGVRSSIEEDGLEDMVLRLELVSPTALDGIQRELGEGASDAHLARALVVGGWTTPMQVYWARVYQAQAAAVSLLALRNCELTWEDQVLPEEFKPLVDIPTAEIVWEATRCLSGPELRALLPPKHTWFGRSASESVDLARNPVPEGALALLSVLETENSLEGLLKNGSGKGDEVRRWLMGLVSCRFVEAVATPVDAEEREAAPEAAIPEEQVLCEESPGLEDAEEMEDGALGLLLDECGAAGPPSAVQVMEKPALVAPEVSMSAEQAPKQPEAERSEPSVQVQPDFSTELKNAPMFGAQLGTEPGLNSSLSMPATVPRELREIATELRALLHAGRALVPSIAAKGKRVEVNKADLRSLLSAVAELSERADAFEACVEEEQSEEAEFRPSLVPEGAGVC